MGTNTKKSVDVATANLLQKLPELYAGGVTEFFVHDNAIAGDKKFLLSLADCVEKKCPELFISLPVRASVIDGSLVNSLSAIYCSIDIPLEVTQKDSSALLFDKKLYKNKAALLNKAELVFGFEMSWGVQKGDSFKAFRDRLDFAVTLYPNHIDFPQFEQKSSPKPTAVYSSKDLDFSCGMAFACRTFYTAGRAVPWFNQIVQLLKISPSSFFADFDEWQQCNNCSYITDFVPEEAEHKEIEKMQLAFLKEKLDEKHKGDFFNAVSDLICLNGAFSRVVEEGEESTIELSYNPDDLLSPYSADIAKFVDNVPEEACAVRIFDGAEGPDYKIL